MGEQKKTARSKRGSHPRKNQTARRKTSQDKEDSVVNMMINFLSDWRGPDEKILRKKIHEIIGGKESTVSDYISRLTQERRLIRSFAVNPRQSSFCHEFRQALTFSLPEMTGNIADFIATLIKRVNSRKISDSERHLYIIDGAEVYGTDYDAILSIVTDNGIAGIAELDQEYRKHRRVLMRVTTWAVGYSYRFSPQLDTKIKKKKVKARRSATASSNETVVASRNESERMTQFNPK